VPSSVTPTRRQKRWSGRLRTAGALCLLAGAVGLVDGLLPHAADPVLGRAPLEAVALGLAMVGAISFGLGRRWR
jgi:hypothetical protein